MGCSFPEALIELRSKMDLSQTRMAAVLGVSYPTINRWENGKTSPTKIMRVRIEKLLKDNGIELGE